MKNHTMSVLFTSDAENHLNDLTIHRTTASLPFGGRYRLIDFALSNLVHANITTIGIVTRNNYNSLMDHIRMGRDWDLNRKNSGITVFPPFNTDFEAVEEFHISKGADITVLTYNTDDTNPRKIIISKDKNNRITDMRYPVASDVGKQLCNLNIYFIKKDLLISLVDNAYAHGAYDFEKDILQKKLDELYIMNYEVTDYVAVIDRIPSYFKHSMELLDPDVREALFYKHSTILTKVKDSVPAKYKEGANVKNSIIADGCVIDGTVENSILFRGVKVGKGAVIRNSIIMEDSIIMDGASLDYTITDKDVIIQSGRKLSGYESYPMVVVKGKVI